MYIPGALRAPELKEIYDLLCIVQYSTDRRRVPPPPRPGNFGPEMNRSGTPEMSLAAASRWLVRRLTAQKKRAWRPRLGTGSNAAQNGS